MFVYDGRLDWKPYGDNETFVIILPDGPVRVGDTAYLFSQWTKDAQGTKKANFFQKSATDWEITSRDIYGKLDVAMSNPAGAKSNMSFKRIWQSKGEQATGAARIWTGKISWSKYASDEMSIFIVPEGFGDGKPVLSLWQWSHDDTGTEKSPSFRAESQKMLSGAGKGVKFSYHSYYDITCTWDETTERLAVHMKGPEANQDLGEYTLSALIDRHSHSWNPPEYSTPEKTEVEVRLPQPQPSLPRILGPLPFPKNLIETLRHTIAFADQPGYLGKYAEDLNAATTENNELRKEIKKLNDDLNVEKAKTGDMTKRLADAQATHAAERKKRDEDLVKGKKHDDEDHKTIDRLVSQLDYERASKAEAQKKLDQTTTNLRAAEARLQAEVAKIVDLTARIATLEAQFEIEKREGDRLRGENKQKDETIEKLEKAKNDLQCQLDQAQADVKDHEALAAKKSKTITEQAEEIIKLNNTIKEKTLAFDNLEMELKDKAKELRTHMHEGHVTPAPVPTVVPEPKLRFKCNIRSESSSGNNHVFLDLNGQGGQNPPVHAISDGSYRLNANQIWEIFSVPGSNTRVVIKNAGNSFVLFSAGKYTIPQNRPNYLQKDTGHGQTVKCERSRDVSDLAAQWDLQGATVDNVTDSTQVRFRNAKDETYLDLSGGNTGNGTAFLTYNGHSGANQAFKLWKH
ncbi:hard-surface inducible [Fusarium subglutinans]|uniref:Hard-surface inducible n=1 Tax=Gibberella subglutinans TaxID=42677 RepID=A0A8H5V764_GIBSU|nr:hard-surface inducible [Fusarium subglutinans]KAF5613622.1 hard-surface inducible [Fusarium subglutinans]